MGGVEAPPPSGGGGTAVAAGSVEGGNGVGSTAVDAGSGITSAAMASRKRRSISRLDESLLLSLIKKEASFLDFSRDRLFETRAESDY